MTVVKVARSRQITPAEAAAQSPMRSARELEIEGRSAGIFLL
jgi:hypothetical protein